MNYDIHNRFTGAVQAGRLREIFDYDTETGVFTYKTRAARRVQVGDVAGFFNSEGYRRVRFEGRTYAAHRLAWLYVRGERPVGMIDHINGVKDDNRIANLRLASRTENLANSRIFRSGKSAPKGVSQMQNGKWSARIQKDRESTFLGYFHSQEEAAAAYKKKATELFGNFARAS